MRPSTAWAPALLGQLAAVNLARTPYWSVAPALHLSSVPCPKLKCFCLSIYRNLFTWCYFSLPIFLIFSCPSFPAFLFVLFSSFLNTYFALLFSSLYHLLSPFFWVFPYYFLSMLATVLINFACLYCTGFGDRLSWVYLNDMQLPSVWGSGSSWHTLSQL